MLSLNPSKPEPLLAAEEVYSYSISLKPWNEGLFSQAPASSGLCAAKKLAIAVNNKIKVAIRQGYGFRNADDLIALFMLRCSDLRPALPGRATA